MIILWFLMMAPLVVLLVIGVPIVVYELCTQFFYYLKKPAVITLRELVEARNNYPLSDPRCPPFYILLDAASRASRRYPGHCRNEKCPEFQSKILLLPDQKGIWKCRACDY